MVTGRRAFIGSTLGMGLGAGLLSAQSSFLKESERKAPPPVPVRKGKITKLFKSPEGYPNAMAASPQGWWLGEQKTDHACLVDWDGRLLKTVKTEAKNTSGLAVGGGYIWMGANRMPTSGVFQTDMNSKTVSHHQVPLGGGGIHGLEYAEGKLWIAALRVRAILRVDPKTFEAEYAIPYAVPRAHGLAWDNGSMWMVTGSADGKAGLIKYDVASARPLEIVEFDERYPDPHGLAMKDGVLYTCDAGIHPGWEDDISTAHGYVCRIEIL